MLGVLFLSHSKQTPDTVSGERPYAENTNSGSRSYRCNQWIRLAHRRSGDGKRSDRRGMASRDGSAVWGNVQGVELVEEGGHRKQTQHLVT